MADAGAIVEAKKGSDFWMRSSWLLSSSVRMSFGSMMITLGRYLGDLSKQKGGKPTSMSYILIFNRVPKEYDFSEDNKLPAGICIPIDQWHDFKRAFAYFFMHLESKSLAEMKLSFGFQDENWILGGHIYEGAKDESFKKPIRNRASVLFSKEKTEMITDAIAAWKPKHKAPPIPATVESHRNALLDEEAAISLDGSGGEDDEAESECGGRDSDEFDDECDIPSTQAQTEGQKKQKKASSSRKDFAAFKKPRTLAARK